METLAMNENDFTALLANLRRSIPDFELFEAVYLNGFTFTELSVSLGIRIQAVSRRIQRVREALGTHLPLDLTMADDEVGGQATYFD